MSLRALIFEMDGALADTEEVRRQAFNAAFIELGLIWAWTVRDYSALRRAAGDYLRVILYIDGLTAPEREKERLRRLAPWIARRKRRTYNALVRSGGAPLRPGVRRIVRDASAAGLTLALVTSADACAAKALLSAEFGRRRCDRFEIVASGTASATRPATNDYGLALSVLGLPSSACIAFEASASGLRAAKAAGLFTVVTPTRWTGHEEFSEADLVLPSLGSHLHPLDPEAAARIGAPYLELASLAAMHEAGRRRDAACILQEAV